MINRDTIFAATIDKGLAPVAQFRKDPSVTEIMINGPREIYVERFGRIEKTTAVFGDEDALIAVAKNIAQFTNKRITETTSRFDSRLPDRSRVHVVMPRCSRKGLCIAIRKFPKNGFTLEKLVDAGSLTPEAQEYLEIVVELERNIIVSGGTGSGKTSFLNALSGKIPQTERLIVIEDVAELQLQQEHLLSFETKGPDRYGQGTVTIRDLFHSALRMRPDRIVIGECRGGEALDLIQAMTSGHGGSMSTLHANTASDALHRLETMALMSGVDVPLKALRPQVASAIELVVQLNRLGEGTRVVSEISEVTGLSPDDRYVLNPIYEQNPAWNRDVGGPRLRPTGNASNFCDAVRAHGLTSKINLTGRVFGKT
jgi:pilus assembly protein CpaF